MAPDLTTTRYTEDAYRLVRVAVKEAIVRPTHQRRPVIATVTDTSSIISSTHAVIARPGTTEPKTSWGSEVQRKPRMNNGHLTGCLSMSSATGSSQTPAPNMILKVISVKGSTDDLDVVVACRKYDNPPVVHETT